MQKGAPGNRGALCIFGAEVAIKIMPANSRMRTPIVLGFLPSRTLAMMNNKKRDDGGRDEKNGGEKDNNGKEPVRESPPDPNDGNGLVIDIELPSAEPGGTKQ